LGNYLDDVEGCSQACLRKTDCAFFLHSENTGDCVMQETQAIHCPENPGLWWSEYHFYKALRPMTTQYDVWTQFNSDAELIEVISLMKQ
jgi:hypothetical protein